MNSDCSCSGNSYQPRNLNPGEVRSVRGGVNSWIDLAHMMPKDPLDILAYAELNGSQGTYLNSSTYLDSTWVTTPLSIGSAPTLTANGTDNLQTVAEATQWNFQHLTWDSGSDVAPPLRKRIFLRAGVKWKNTIMIDFGGSSITDVQLSFLTNAATRGDEQGTIPVISWSSIDIMNQIPLVVTLKRTGQFCMGIRTLSGGNAAMYESEWIVVA